MNKRITLLVLEASDPKTGWFDRQKFARLIVQECIETMYNTEQMNVAQFVEITLKEHFEIK